MLSVEVRGVPGVAETLCIFCPRGAALQPHFIHKMVLHEAKLPRGEKGPLYSLGCLPCTQGAQV